MGEEHSPSNHNPHKTMISTNIGFPFATNHQLVTDMANSAKETIETIKPYVTRTNDLEEQFAKRVHELMNFRPHTVDTDGF